MTPIHCARCGAGPLAKPNDMLVSPVDAQTTSYIKLCDYCHGRFQAWLAEFLAPTIVRPS